MRHRLELTREQVLAHRLRVGALDVRLPSAPASLRRVAWAGLPDSMPRAALLGIHARVDGTTPMQWQDPLFVQLWGPRFSAYVVAAEDRAVFTLGRQSGLESRRRLGDDLADRVDAWLAGAEAPMGEAARALGLQDANQLRYAAPTGRLLIRWDGARQPTIRTVPAPDVDPEQAQRELVRRYLHVLGPGTAAGFGDWAGLRAQSAGPRFEALLPETTPVRVDGHDAWILTSDEPSLLGPPAAATGVRLLPSGDTYYLLQGDDRELLVPDPDQRAALWTSRVWPGAVLVDGEIVGTWRRADEKVTVSPWRTLPPAVVQAVEAEATALPLPGLRRPLVVRWAA